MTSFHPKDHDLHTRDGKHRARPPAAELAGLTEEEAAAYTKRWEGRRLRHLAAHANPTVKANPVRVASRARPSYVQYRDACGLPFGRSVAAALRERSITQAEAASWLGLTKKLFEDRVLGVARFTLAEAAYLCDYLGLDIGEVIRGVAAQQAQLE